MDDRNDIISEDSTLENINIIKPTKFDKIIRFLDEKKWAIFIIVLTLLFIAFGIDAFLKKDKNDIQILYTGYEFVNLLSGNRKNLTTGMYILAVIFLIKFLI